MLTCCDAIARFTGCKNFVCKREKFKLNTSNTFVDFKPMERFENVGDV